MVISPVHLNQAIRPVSVDVVPSFHIILIDSRNEVRVTFRCVIAVIGEIDVGSPAKVLIVEIYTVDTDIYTTGTVNGRRIVIYRLHFLIGHQIFLQNDILTQTLVEVDRPGQTVVEETEINTEVIVGQCLPFQFIIAQFGDSHTVYQASVRCKCAL